MRMFRIFLPLMLLLSSQAFALSPEEIEAVLNERLPELQVVAVRPGRVEGLYEVDLQGTQTIFVSTDGKHVIAGDLFAITSLGPVVNLSEQMRTSRMGELNEYRKETLDAYDESKMVVFAPSADKIKTTITVFTDTTCGFCRKLHRDVPELNRLGIAVRYMAWPRGGLDSPGANVMVSAWCAKNPAKALTLAKLGQEIEPATCENPVAEEYEMGVEFGVDATPALVLEDGTLIKGYRDAKSLAVAVGVPYVDS